MLWIPRRSECWELALETLRFHLSLLKERRVHKKLNHVVCIPSPFQAKQWILEHRWWLWFGRTSSRGWSR
jgi:hypothetical protein